MIEINQIADVLNYTEGLKAVVFDLDDTLYGEKEYIRSGYRAVAKVIPQVKNAERKLWRLFLEKKPAIDEVLSMEGIYTEEIRQRYMDHIIVTDELGGGKYRKPNEAAFIQMADKLNVAFTQMCYVGDNIKKDFSAPLKLGMRAVWFRNQDGLY